MPSDDPIKPPRLCGLLNLDKPAGLTSRDVVDLIARPLRPTRVGHAGTLDPLATGVLVVCVGTATRLVEQIQALPKTYRTIARLGSRSDTLDADGSLVETPGAVPPPEADVQKALEGQVGTILQVPPQFSALKVAGQRAYDAARAGRTVELTPRPVTVHRIDLLSYQWPNLELEIACGGGTYIRSIVRDIGEALGCGGLVDKLVRTAIGPFTLADAIDPRGLTALEIVRRLRPAREAVSGLPQIILSDEQVRAIRHGQAIDGRGLWGAAPMPGGQVALLAAGDDLVALAEADPRTGRVIPRKVLSGE